DEIEYLPPKPPVRDVLGGAGSYSALGARLFSPPPLSKSVGWFVDRGSDFPEAITAVVESWETSAVMRTSAGRLTTRGWNGYVDQSERRAFRYTTPKKRLTAEDLAENPDLLQARAFHLICNPTRCRELVTDIVARRKAADPEGYTRPVFIWEPVPDRCVPDELLNCTNTLPLVDICSPNHAELAGFMGSDGLDPATGEISTAAIEQNCEQLLASMPLQSYALVVRAGEKGCFIAKNGGRVRGRPATTSDGKKQQQKQRMPVKKKELLHGGLQPDTDFIALFANLVQDDEGFVAREEIEVDPGIERWIPAYYQPAAIDGPVVDPTGGGNTFLGALAVALARGKPVEEACVWASVAASFAIEQVGVPMVGRDRDGNETWNGVRVEDRLEEFRRRL
ncbi:Ribokinase-like protein, partial [Lasiosphaeria ovina]